MSALWTNVPPHRDAMGRGTIHRKVNRGGVEDAGASYPSTMLRMVPLPTACGGREEL
jgi:hypothetical protein